MSKSLKKLIDINGLREFKNKLVGTDSAYVQTGAVDQTIAGTKTFSKPIIGSVTGSSGSCTGNAATATRADSAAKADTAINATNANYASNATNAAKLGNIASSGYVQTGNVNQTIDGTKTFSAAIASSVKTNTYIDGNKGVAIINSTAPAGYNMLYRIKSTNGVFTGGVYNQNYELHYTVDTTIAADTNAVTYTTTLMDESGDAIFSNNIFVRGAINGNLNGNVTGNAATATKLATARTIALSGAATGTATGFDGSGDITIPVTALAASAIRAQWYAAYPDGAEAHNAMWGGRDITAAFDAGTVSANIANGTFKDIFPGDYITKSVTISGTTYNVNWVVADCDYWINKGDGDTGMETHHVVIVPQQPIFGANMNDTNTTEGGYAGSRMYTETIPACAAGIVSAFGSEHILTFRDHLTRDLNASAVSSGITVWTGAPNWNGAWYSQQCNLMSEAMVYDGPHCASSALDNIMATRQMSGFRLSERLINYKRQWWWLRDVVSSTGFALVDNVGNAAPRFASGVDGVRPFALLY